MSKSKRIAVASIMQESNTFSPVGTRYDDFAPVFGKTALEKHRGKLTEMGGFLATLERAGVEPAPVCAAWAITAGRMLRADFERLCGDFARALAKQGPVDALLLSLHGAQTAEGVDDAEGRLLEVARETLGPDVPIVITLDLHANVTCRMVELASGVFGYRTYPHIDMFESGERAAEWALRILAGEVEPVVGFCKLPLIVPAENMQTTAGPMLALQQAARRCERKRSVESVSVFGVQPWLDIEEMGCSVVATVNKDQALADRIAAEIGRDFWECRRELDVELTPPSEAIQRALAIEGGPVVLSESSDSTGSGSPGDSTGLLRELLRAKLDEPACIFLVDPDTVRAAMEAGVGATLDRKIGGAFDRKHSKPVRVKARVRMLSDGRWTPRARGYNPGIEQSMGRAAVLDVGRLSILVAERSTMTVDPALFRSHGLDPTYMKIVAVKSPNGFRAAYGPIAKEMIVVDTPGVSTANLERLPYKRIPRPLYPFDREMRLPRGL
ncbi:MAG: M81 family metallopeptidase [Bryobacterales bacterium]